MRLWIQDRVTIEHGGDVQLLLRFGRHRPSRPVGGIADRLLTAHPTTRRPHRLGDADDLLLVAFPHHLFVNDLGYLQGHALTFFTRNSKESGPAFRWQEASAWLLFCRAPACSCLVSRAGI